jgi:sugar phosphate isomerase/epimerase
MFIDKHRRNNIYPTTYSCFLNQCIEMNKNAISFIWGIVLVATFMGCQTNTDSNSKEQATALNSAKQVVPWKVATIAYTFRKFTFFEAISKTKELGINYIGGYPGQIIGEGVAGNMDYKMDVDTRNKVLAHLKSQGVKLIDYGVITPNTEEDWKTLFEFAKAMGIENIVSEPAPEQLQLVSKLCDTYEIDVAIHNHPAPSRYWHPDTLLASISGLSARIGACADVGHWIRSGLDPVESLKKLDGHIKELHFKDESEKGPKALEVVWGTGQADVKEMLAELHRQRFSGFLSIEYESNPEDNLNEIKESLVYYNQIVKSFQ